MTHIGDKGHHPEPTYSRPNPDCAARDRPHGAHQLAGPGGNKPGSRCAGVPEDEFDRLIDEAKSLLAEVEHIEASADLAGRIRDHRLSFCEHGSAAGPACCSPCLRDRLLADGWTPPSNGGDQ